jgi:periplasmic protein TonB
MSESYQRAQASGFILHIQLGLFLAVAFVLAGCQKHPDQPPSKASTSEEATPMPTGLVKNPVKQSGTDIVELLNKAPDKSAAQIAKEEQQREAQELKEAKEAKEAKLAAEAREQKARESSKPIAAATPAPIARAADPSPSPVLAPSTNIQAPKTSAAVEVEQNTLKVLASPQPRTPVAAVRAGISEGVVTARVHIETDGKVSKVEIVKAKPANYFEKEVIAAASQWRYAAISRPQTSLLEFNFKLDN